MRSFSLRGVVIFAAVLSISCGKPTGVPPPSPGNPQKLPFDREARSSGISPSQSLIPPAKRLAEGTAMTVRLRKALSSARAESGESFEGTLDDPVVMSGQSLIARGALVTGRVLDAKPSTGDCDPGYLRIALVSVNVADKPILIETSSIFAKGALQGDDTNRKDKDKDVVFGPDRRLTFHLAQPIDLP
jgi:hypothetical protein